MTLDSVGTVVAVFQKENAAFNLREIRRAQQRHKH